MSNRKLTIFLDMDEVITETLNHWLNLYNDEYDDDLKKEDLKGWNVHTWVKPECDRDVYKYLSYEGFFLNLDPIPGAISGINWLLDNDITVCVSTAVPKVSAKTGYLEKISWLKKFVPRFDINNFISIHRKDLLYGDIMFDDGLHNLIDFKGVSVCMDRPWNRGENSFEKRCESWSDFILFVKYFSDDPAYRRNMFKKSALRLHKLTNSEDRKIEQWGY